MTLPAEQQLRDALLAPRSIALIGASDDSAKAASRPLGYLRSTGYPGLIYPVNQRRATVGAERAYACLTELPEAPDHAFIMTPAHTVPAVIDQCVARGVTVATILDGGFADAGPDGARLQHDVVQAASAGGVRLLGPNSLGIVDLRSGLKLTANAVFADASQPPGGTLVVSQSGSMIGSIYSRAARHHLGLAALVSVGCEADLSVGEICSLTLNDPDVTGYLLFLESLRHADQLAAFAIQAGRRDKPVAVYKLGRSAAAAALARSHTGALAGEDDLADEFFREYGIARLDTLDGLLETLPLLARLPPRREPSAACAVGIMTTTGGGAAMVVDQLGVRGVPVIGPGGHTRRKLTEAGITAPGSTIVDLTLAGTRPEVMSAALDAMLTAPEFGMVLAVAGSSARLQPELAVAPIVAAAADHPHLAAFLVPDAPTARDMLLAASVPVFQSPETCADVISAALRRRETPTGRPPPDLPPSDAVVKLLSESESYRVLDRLGIGSAPHATLVVSQCEAETTVAESGLVPFPVAVKVLDPVLAHKSDVGGVILNVIDREQLLGAVRAIARDVSSSVGQSVRRVLVQAMSSGLGELLLGYRADREVGPIVMVAVGGRLTELYHDRSVRLAPVTPTTARAMLEEVRGIHALTEYRGAPAADLDAVAHAIVALSQLARDSSIVELEINPLLVHPAGHGVTAVDAVCTVRAAETT